MYLAQARQYCQYNTNEAETDGKFILDYNCKKYNLNYNINKWVRSQTFENLINI